MGHNYMGVIKGDTRSLDYSSHGRRVVVKAIVCFGFPLHV